MFESFNPDSEIYFGQKRKEVIMGKILRKNQRTAFCVCTLWNLQNDSTGWKEQNQVVINTKASYFAVTRWGQIVLTRKGNKTRSW